MKVLDINRCLNEETRKKCVYMYGELFSLHITDDEAIITDIDNYTKIYAIYSLDFYNNHIAVYRSYEDE